MRATRRRRSKDTAGTRDRAGTRPRDHNSGKATKKDFEDFDSSRDQFLGLSSFFVFIPADFSFVSAVAIAEEKEGRKTKQSERGGQGRGTDDDDVEEDGNNVDVGGRHHGPEGRHSQAFTQG